MNWSRILFMLVLALLLWSMFRQGAGGVEISYREFRDFLAAGEVKSASIASDRITGEIRRKEVPPDDKRGKDFDFQTVKVDGQEEDHKVVKGGDAAVAGSIAKWILSL